MVDLLTQWDQTQETQRKAQQVVDNCRERKTAIIRALLNDGMTQLQVAVLLKVSDSTVGRLAEYSQEELELLRASGIEPYRGHRETKRAGRRRGRERRRGH